MHIAVAQVLRLGFHDCLKYKDGTGGCDGCVDFSNMGKRGGAEAIGVDGENNGLGGVIEVLSR